MSLRDQANGKAASAPTPPSRPVRRIRRLLRPGEAAPARAGNAVMSVPAPARKVEVGPATLYQGDCMSVLRRFRSDYFHAIVTDPPYGLTTDKKGGTGQASECLGTPAGRSRITTGFMGLVWDNLPPVEAWREALRVARPGAHLLACGGTRTYHRLVTDIERAGWEVRDCILWVYSQGFPKSLDVGKALDAAAGAVRRVVGTKRCSSGTGDDFGKAIGGQGGGVDVPITEPATALAKYWEGWGTALKPAVEMICVARKPLVGTVVDNVCKWGCGALNIDATRIPVGASSDDPRLGGKGGWKAGAVTKTAYGTFAGAPTVSSAKGRWPANMAHDGSPEVMARFPECQTGLMKAGTKRKSRDWYSGNFPEEATNRDTYADRGSAGRFFYTAKASPRERRGSTHPTVKPLALMDWLVRLVTPPGGCVLDPFAGTATTGEACLRRGFRFIGIEREATYMDDAVRRLRAAADKK